MSVDILGTNCDQCQSTVQCCFMSTETVKLIRIESPGRPPRLSHSSWTLNYVEVDIPTLLYPLRLVEVLLYIHKNGRFIRDGSPGRPPRLSHSSWALEFCTHTFVPILVPTLLYPYVCTHTFVPTLIPILLYPHLYPYFCTITRPPDDKNLAYRRPPLSAYEVFRELISQRLGQVG